jgi:hypothetical protein
VGAPRPPVAAGTEPSTLPSISPDLILIERAPLPHGHDAVAEELAASSHTVYWKSQILLAKATIDYGEYLLNVATQNHIRALERFIPFRRPTDGEPRAGASGSGVINVNTSDEDEDPIPPLGESDDDEPMFSDFKEPEDVAEPEPDDA